MCVCVRARAGIYIMYVTLSLFFVDFVCLFVRFCVVLYSCE